MRKALTLIAALVAVAMFTPAATAAEAAEATTAATCSPAKVAKLKKQLARHKKRMGKQRRKYFATHHSAKQRKAFVRRQKAKTRRLKRAIKRCQPTTPTPPLPSPPAPRPPAAPKLTFGRSAGVVVQGGTVTYRPGAPANFELRAAPASRATGVAFPALGGGWAGGGTDASAPYSRTYMLNTETLAARIGTTISLRRAGGAALGTVTPGLYAIHVEDASDSRSFRLFGPGVEESTSDAFVGEVTWTVELRAGAQYRFESTGDASGSFTTAAAPPAAAKAVRSLHGATKSAPATFTLRADATAPTTTARCDGAACSPETTDKAVTVALAASDPGAGVAQIRYTLDGSIPAADHGAIYDKPFSVTASTTVRFRAIDRVGNAEPVKERDIAIAPPKDTLQAPPSDPSVPQNFTDSTEFLYTGPNPVQTGVAEGTIKPKQVAVVRGRVIDRMGKGLEGVTVTVLDHPELGQTLSRPGGYFDLAVNGGGELVIKFEKDGLLPVQRQVEAPWQDFVVLEDEVVMIGYDSRVTEIDLDSSEPIQTARGSEQADLDGERQATVMFREGTEATMTLEDGSQVPLDELHVRATEYTVGARGEEAMPAELPETTGYTYAVELSVDEAEDAGATRVDFSKKVAFYLENFLDFNVGSAVPVGFYDREKGKWVPSENGRVVAIVGESGGRAQLDLDGDGAAETGERLGELGVTDSELAELAELYEPGQTLWRVQLSHFTPVDCNWLSRRLPRNPTPNDNDGDGEPDDLPEPDAEDPSNSEEPTDDDCPQQGSVIDCENRVLGKDVGIAGTPLRLHYSSERVPGRKAEAALDIPVSGGSLPDGLKRIDVSVRVGGTMTRRSFAAQPNQRFEYSWDGVGPYGRPVSGNLPASVTVTYVYPTYRQQQLDELIIEGERARVELNYFARVIEPELYTNLNVGIDAWAARTRELGRSESTVTRRWESFTKQDGRGSVGVWDARGAGLGGWTLDIHHVYDPVRRAVQLGSGEQRSPVGVRQILQTLAGKDTCGDPGDGGPGRELELCNPTAGAVGPDGTLYFANDMRVYKLTPDGTVTRVAGSGRCGWDDVDGAPALEAGLCFVQDVEVGGDGSLYVVSDHHAIHRIDTAGRIYRFAGFGSSIDDNGPALEAGLSGVDGVAASASGGLYISESGRGRLRYVGPDGMISTVAGDAENCGGDVFAPRLAADDEPLDRRSICVSGGVAEGPDGSIYVVAQPGVLRIRPDGILSAWAGTRDEPENADGIPATKARVNPSGRGSIAVGPDGALYIPEGGRIRRVGQDGIITTVAGTPPGMERNDEEDGGIATAEGDLNTDSVALTPDGSLLLADNDQIRKVTTPLPGLADRPISVPSADGGEVWQFDRHGRHLRTVDPVSGATVWEFGYEDGRLVTVTDRAGQVTTIERDGAGNPLAIVAPGGRRTVLTLRADGFLKTVENPAHETTTFDYTGSGLLTAMTNAENETSSYQYDTLGRLRVAKDAEGGEKTFSTVVGKNDATVSMTTKQGRTTRYALTRTPDGALTRKTTGPSGTATVSTTQPDGTRVTTYPDGTTETLEPGPDPRFGMLAPLAARREIVSPGAPTMTVTSEREATFSNDDPIAGLATLTDTVGINGDTFVREYDRAARTVTQTSAQGRKVITKLDALGRPVEVSQPGRAPVVTTYDDATGLMTKLQQGNQFWSYEYGDDRQITARTDAAGRTVRYERDAMGRPTKVTLPSGRVHELSYDDVGRPETITQPATDGEAAPVHRLAYTGVGLQERYTAPTGAAYDSAWTPDRDRMSNTLPGRQAQTFTYKPGGRLDQLAFGEGGLGYGFDDAGRLTGMTRTTNDGGPDQGLAMEYDGVLMSDLTATGAASGHFEYTWTPDALLDDFKVDGNLVEIQRDKDGLTTKYGPFGHTRGGPGGEQTAITGPSMNVAIEHDEAGRIKSRTHTVGGSQAYRLDLTYDLSGRIATRTERLGNATPETLVYEYDGDGRLRTVRAGTANGPVQEQYDYDGRGNRHAAGGETATYGLDDRLIARAGIEHTYDAAGFLKARGADTFDYSGRGELLRATVGGTTVTYAYDAMGRRTARFVDGTKTNEYLYGSPDNPFELTASKENGQLTTYFYTEAGTLFAYRRGTALFYVGTDQVGSPRRITNSAGQVVKTIAYDSFGRITSETGTESMPIGFAGGLPDPVTGLVRFGLRDYDPAAGRWTAKNPLLFGGSSSNLYTYAGNNPVTVTDRTGLPSVAASAGLGGYLGIKAAWNNQGFSFCWEFGVGVGGSVEVDPIGESIDESKSRYFVGAEGKAGPLKGSLEYEYDSLGGPCMEGKGELKPKLCFMAACKGSDGVVTAEPNLNGDILSMADKLKNLSKLGFAAQAKAGVRVCKAGTW